MFDITYIGDEIIKGTKEVFSTMLMVDIECESFDKTAEFEIQSNLTSVIGLGGGIRGMLAVHCPASIAKTITGSFLGMEVEELDDDVKDAIGEVTNMVAGNLKVSYTNVDINIELAIPTTIIGESFSISGIADANRIVVPMKIGEETFWVEHLYLITS